MSLVAVLLVISGVVVVAAIAAASFFRRRTAWCQQIDQDMRPYPCVTVWLTRDGDDEADAKILAALKEHRDR